MLINPVYAVVGVASAVALAYGGYKCYSAGADSVQRKWDEAHLKWQQERNDFKDRITLLERNLRSAQVEAQNASVVEKREYEAKLAAQRASADAAAAGLRNTSEALRRRLVALGNDSAALPKCQAAASTLQDLLGACTAEYRELGSQAQRDLILYRAPGLECERNYDAAEKALKSLGQGGASN